MISITKKSQTKEGGTVKIHENLTFHPVLV
jgi:hypothetical protein